MEKPPRAATDQIQQWHKDCAFEVQQRLEKIVYDMTVYWLDKTQVRNMCISGGVGLNVKMNGNLFDSGIVDDLFVYPICADAGSSIGAAMALTYQLIGHKNKKLTNLYLGNYFSDDEINEILVKCNLKFSQKDSIEKSTARLISEGKIVGWFQEKMEGGPRALGARSILADPRFVDSRDKVNKVIKYREEWRPFTLLVTLLWGISSLFLLLGNQLIYIDIIFWLWVISSFYFMFISIRQSKKDKFF